MTIHVLGRSLHTSEFPIPLPLPLGDRKVTASGARHPFPKNPSVSSLPLSREGPLLEILSLWVPAAGRAGEGLGPQPVTFSEAAQAPMVEPELTEVGELHSLTDWQVSEASEEAELDEFCSREGPRVGTACRHKRSPVKNKKMGEGGGGGKVTQQRDRQTCTERRMREAELGLFPPKAAPTQRLPSPGKEA